MLSEANRKASGDIKLNTSFFRTSLAGAGGGTGLALTRQNTRKERMNESHLAQKYIASTEVIVKKSLYLPGRRGCRSGGNWFAGSKCSSFRRGTMEWDIAKRQY